MSNPQKENGFSGIANELLTEIYRCKFNGTQFSILLCVIRWTYGFQRKSHTMSDGFISKDTYISTKLVNRELGVLVKSKVITVYKQGTYRDAREIGINKDYDLWTIERRVNNETTPQLVGTSQIEGIPQSGDKGTPQSVDELHHNQGDKKEIINKDINKNNIIPYRDVYDYYLSLDLKRHRAYTKDMEKAISSAMKNNKYTIEYCKTLLDRHKKAIELTKNNEYPIKVRTLTEFFGQKVANAKHLICSEYEEGGVKYETYLKAKEIDKHVENTVCLFCKGKTVVPDPKLKWVDCPKCNGTGKNMKGV